MKSSSKKALASYEEFARETGEDEKARAGVALAFRRVGHIRATLGLKEAEAAYRRSQDLYTRLVADFPQKPGHRLGLALVTSPCLTVVAVSPCGTRTEFRVSHYIVVAWPSGGVGGRSAVI
jgi:hypothetical protein